jgi:hypothetical protein
MSLLPPCARRCIDHRQDVAQSSLVKDRWNANDMPARVHDFDRAPNRKRESYGKERRSALLVATAITDLAGPRLRPASDLASTPLS